MSKAVFPGKPAVRPLAGSDYELAQDFYFRATVGGAEGTPRPTGWGDGAEGTPRPTGWGDGAEGTPRPTGDGTGVWEVVVHVKAGFRTDGASIPRLLWRVFGSPYDPDIFPAAIAHDALYRGEIVPRRDADAAFLALMVEGGVKYDRAWLVFLGVRLFGWLAWLGHTRESVAEARRHIEMDFAPQAIRKDQT